MTRTNSICFNLPILAGILTFALMPALAQGDAPKGKIHGHVSNPAGVAETAGSVSLSGDGGHTSDFTFPVSRTGDYAGEAAEGIYTVIFREPDTPPDQSIDSFDNVLVVAGEDLRQDFDMSRKEFIDALPAETRKQFEDLKNHKLGHTSSNDSALAVNQDLGVANQDLKDADNARANAAKTLGPAKKAEAEARAAKVAAAKYTEVETLMLKDTASNPDAPIVWMVLGQARVGLKKYAEAETALKKTLDLESKAATPQSEIQGAAYAELGEIYARNGKVPEAEAAFDDAVKVDAPKAAHYLMKEAVIFSGEGNTDAMLAVAEKAIKNDPSQAVFYYLKGQGLLAKATVDPKTKKRVLPPVCKEAYEKYLEMAPDGAYSADAKAVLAKSERD